MLLNARLGVYLYSSIVLCLVAASSVYGATAGASRDPMSCEADPSGRRVVCADVAAFDQILVYNRFGSFNPFGMMFGLTRDLSQGDLVTARNRSGDAIEPDADYCDSKDGTELGEGALEPGNVRLKDCKRPRPMVLRSNVNDILKIRLRNLLTPAQPGVSETFCRSGNEPDVDPAEAGAAPEIKLKASIDRARIRQHVSETADESAIAHGEAMCKSDSKLKSPAGAEAGDTDWPLTRGVTFAVQGLHAVARGGAQVDQVDPACLGLRQVMPGDHVDCYYEADREGTYFLSSTGAPAGGEGDGGSITHGLFGAVVVEARSTKWYRSQVSKSAFDVAWPAKPGAARHARTGSINYEALSPASSLPVLNLVHKPDPAINAVEIIHSDLNAVIYRDGRKGCELTKHDETCAIGFREFSVFFHDELKTFYTRNFEELGKFGQLAGVRDGFGINYGASGMGALLLANRKGIGPTASCVECLYEEFFLGSWANGDPALLESYSDDPSNVHHSYINDSVVFRNFHAGPKETHVFHLHAHQWFAGNDPSRGSYLDSQTVGPEQGFSYDIYHGGLLNYSPKDPAKRKGWWETLGGGNRNRAPGDSIFHCHLYPHFAQGMWELWRNHDVVEDGTRKLPDGQKQPGLSVAYNPDFAFPRKGSVDRATGNWTGAGTQADGTPVPAIVPLPDQALPLLPSYTANATGMPGYPFYIAGEPGRRAPQAPLDVAEDGGLPRHVIKSGERKFEVKGQEKLAANPGTPEWEKAARQYVAKTLSLGNFAAHIDKADIELPGANGSALEQAAMGFHFDGKAAHYQGDNLKPAAQRPSLALVRADGSASAYQADEGGYGTSFTPKPGAATPSGPGIYHTNGAPPKRGAPFADPCAVASGLRHAGRKQDGIADDTRMLAEQVDPLRPSDGTTFVPDPGLRGFRKFEVSAVQLDLVTNRAGWHDPQARINVLTRNSGQYKDVRKVSADEKPFFFRALSGECIEFRHTNELPKDLDLDDFQVKTPTDTIGQHIHLVKFDVTASDGSGNGWNYEDGTFAPDEVVTRICASTNLELAPKKAQYCQVDGVPKPEFKNVWKQKLGDRAQQPFQTTVQRWYADPILSPVDATDRLVDRTMRTVFTHDHFGPSSIQQHGFYSALLVEPPDASICSTKNAADCINPSSSLTTVADGGEGMTGVDKLITMPDPNGGKVHENYREYALAVADFATLYDPQDYDSAADIGKAGREPKGMEALLCEARNRASPSKLAERCNYALEKDADGFHAPGEDWSPAWVAGGMTGDKADHAWGPDMFMPANDPEIADLAARLTSHRKIAAGCNPADAACDRLAKPVAAPARPESISVDHHDPYLVNYRGEPVPLRVGTVSGSITNFPCTRQKAEDWVNKSGSSWTLSKSTGRCSVDAQRKGDEGDMANVFLSSVHSDPATPVIETYDGERLVMRMIQGAQEVQHVFNLDGYGWTRHIDQRFAAGSRKLEVSDHMTANQTAYQACIAKARTGRPLDYFKWFEGKLPADPNWTAHEDDIRNCDNVDGRTTAQEIGISEHFEFRGQFRQSVSGAESLVVGQKTVSQSSTDYAFHFGSSDDIWNGAWGLLRVYASPAALDMSSCRGGKLGDGAFGRCTSAAAADIMIGKRLAELKRDRGEGSSTELSRSGPPPLAVSCPAGAPEKFAAVMAVTAGQVWGKAAYGSSLTDKDGLALIRFDRNDLPSVTDRNDWNAMWNAPPRRPTVASLIAKAKLKYPDGPQPFTLNVAAGDCVSLAIINAMDAKAGSAGAHYLSDSLGDALMPPITKLNVDPAQSNDGQENQTVNGRRDAENLRPSARLALRLQLPVLNDPQSLSMPAGWNAMGALAPATNSITLSDGEKRTSFSPRGETAELMTFYAGQLRLPNPDLNGLPGLLDKVCARLTGQTFILGSQSFNLPAAGCAEAAPAGDADVKYLGRNVFITVDQPTGFFLADFLNASSASAAEKAALRNSIENAWSAAAADAIADASHWMPYAFGPIPLKSFGDVISHPTHGLFGVVNVVPQSWTERTDTDAAGASPQVPVKRYAKGNKRLREFTLALQDGLGLDDANSGLRPEDKNGNHLAEKSGGVMKPIHPVPNCIVCDDSYDLGEKAVNHRSAAFGILLRDMGRFCAKGHDAPASSKIESNTNLNACLFPQTFFTDAKAHGALVMNACEGEELVVRVVHPGGRQRQHTFTTIGLDYDDLFPSFGFPHAALLGPGKVVTASLTRSAVKGTYLWFNGTAPLREGGSWGLLDVKSCN